MNSVYLDHAATTPVHPEVGQVFVDVATTLGNPSSIHSHGRNARRLVEEAREEVAAAFEADPAEVIFTSGGTEADNLAIHGGWFTRREHRPGLVVSTIEHPAVIDTAQWLADAHGAQVHLARVDAGGRLDVGALADYLDSPAGAGVGLISLMWANNETGVFQPVTEIVALARPRGVSVHTDAVQAAAQVPVNFAAAEVEAMSISGHKLGAPVGIGALIASRSFAMTPHMHGGLQERGVRSGTVNAAGAQAFAAALRIGAAERGREAARREVLRDELERGICALAGDAHVWGAGQARLPSHLLVSIPSTRSEAMLFGLDMAGIAASAGSACQAGVVGASPVVLAMGGSEDHARGALRFTFGRTNTRADVEAVLAVLPGVLARSRAAFS